VNWRTRIYLANEGVAQGYTNTFIERAFHREFVGTLLSNYRCLFKENEWKRINPTGFQYGTGGDVTEKGQVSENLLEEGFLNDYAISSLENDFSELAAHLFTGGEEFWQTVDRYGKIRRKAMIAIDFYHALDPTFTEDYFRRLVMPGSK